jgi:hypothetical protein
MYDVENQCVLIHDALADRIFHGIQNYYLLLPHVIPLVDQAGMNSEALLSRADFEQFLRQTSGNSDLNRLLYLFDCRKLVSGIQECSKEVCYLSGEFYRTLNLEELFYPHGLEPDGLRWISSPVTTKLIGLLQLVYIRLHSLLDYVTKVVYEIEHLKMDFATYPRLSCSTILFGDRRRTRLNTRVGTVFEASEPMKEVEAVRNLVIHDGLLDDMPKVYKVIEDRTPIEKYILMPDRTEGRFDKSNNRNLFYGRTDKINLRLPSLIRDFQSRLTATLALALASLKPA